MHNLKLLKICISFFAKIEKYAIHRIYHAIKYYYSSYYLVLPWPPYYPGIRYYFTTESTGHMPRDLYGNLCHAPPPRPHYENPQAGQGQHSTLNTSAFRSPHNTSALNSTNPPANPSQELDEEQLRKRHQLLEQRLAYFPTSW